MPRVHITDKGHRKLVGEPGREVTYVDTAMPGFGLRVTSRGQRSFVYRYTSPVTGKQRRLVLGDAATLPTKDARAKALEFAAIVADGGDPAIAKVERRVWTCAEMIDEFLADVEAKTARGERSPATLRLYRQKVRDYIRPHMGPQPVTAIDYGFINGMLRDRQGAVRNHILTILGGMFRMARRHGHIAMLPTLDIERAPDKKLRRYLSEDEIGRIGVAMDELEAEGANPIPLDVFRCCLLTGRRQGEIKSLRWDQVDFDRRRITLTEHKTARKTGDIHEIVIHPELEAVLRKRLANQICDFVFPTISKRRTFAHITALYRPWQAVLARAGITVRTRVHDIRHAVASMALNSGVDLATIGAILGHKSRSTTNRYAHICQDRVEREATNVGAAISAAMRPTREAAE